MYQKILVTTDGSALSKKAVRSAIELASATGAHLVALYVVPRYPVSYFEGSIAMNPNELARTEKVWADKGQAMVDDVVRIGKSAGVDVTPVVMTSDLVAESIIRAAKKYKCDLVTMASHGRKGLKRLLLGSETQHVLTHCTVPVLVLR